MRKTLLGTALFAAILLAACGTQPPASQQAAKKPPEPAIPEEIRAVGASALGAEAEVLAFGNLARTGAEQVLVVNRLPKNPKGVPPGILVTRVAIVEREGGKWKEVFRGDEHLKNPKGYLGGTPRAPVSGWRLQFEQSDEKGLSVYFTPLQQPTGGYIQTIAVRWNTKVKRYQSLDRNYENFLGESPFIEEGSSTLRR